MKLFLCLLISLTPMFAFGSVKGKNNVIKFDANNDGQAEMTLNRSELSLSGNLSSSRLSVGGATTNQTLNISGTFGVGIQIIDSDITLSDNSYILADTSDNSLNLELPYAGNLTGREYMIKKSSGLNTILVSGNFENSSTGLRLKATPNRSPTSFVSLISSDNTWWIQDSREVEFVDFSEIPLILSGLNLWLDASDSSTIGKGASDNVYQWNDKSGLDNHVYQSVNANQPTFITTDSRANNQSSIGSSTGTGMVGLSSANSIQARRIYCITAYKDGADSTFDGYSCLFAGPDSFGTERVMGDQGTADLFSSSVITDEVFFNGKTSSNTTVLPLPLSLVVVEGSVNQTWSIGFNGVTTNRTWEGPICEIVFSDGTESEYEKQLVEGYLAWKWGLEGDLDSSHPYKNSAP